MDAADHCAERNVNPAHWLQEHGDFLFRYAVSRIRDPEVAEEIVQETLVAAIGAVDQYSGQGTERAWLLAIQKRKIIDHFRRRSRLAAVSLSEGEEAAFNALFDGTGHWRADPRFLGKRPDERLEREEFWAALRDCISRLPSRQADVFVMRELDGSESDAICKDLEISTSNLWVLLHRARLQLATCLRGRWRQELKG